MVYYRPGDTVATAVHKGTHRRDHCTVERIRPDGRVVVLGRGNRRMTLKPHQLHLVKKAKEQYR